MEYKRLKPGVKNKTDTIGGTRIWHLGGVNIDKVPAITRTNAWIHYSDMGDDGWGLVCTQAQAESWQKHFHRAGISIETWPRLPYKPLGFKIMTIPMLAILLVFIANFMPLLFDIEQFLNNTVPFLQIPDIAQFREKIFLVPFVIFPVFILAAHWSSRRCRHIRFAPGLKGVMQYTTIKGNYAHPPNPGKS